jgi:hypothetical protein
MENYDTYKQAISEAEKAEGTAARKMQAYNESVAYSINQLSAAWEGFTQKLEASPAVKGVYWILTQGINNLDHILQQLVPLIATFNADKIVSLAKFLSPLVTTPLKAIRHPMDTVGKSKGAFYENMTQKMTAENTSAIEELTNATKDNTAALRGEKSKSGNGGTNKTNINNNDEAKKVRPGSIQDLQNQIDTDEQSIKDLIASGKNENDPIIQRLRERQAEKQKQILNKQMRSARLKTGVASGIGAGAVRFANKGSSFLDEAMGVSGVEVDTGEALAMGVAQGALTGVATAFMGPAGAVLASAVGDILSSLWKKFAHADEIDRKERVEDAKKQLEAIKGIGNSVTGLIDLNKKDQSLWDSGDWKQFNEQVETINEALEKSELGDKIINLGDSTQTLSEYFEEAARTGNKEMLARVEAERIRFEAEETYAAGEQDRYDLQKEIAKNEKKLSKLDEDDVSERKQLNAAIKAARAEIEDYTKALNKSYMKAAFYSSGVETMDSTEIANASLDRVIRQIGMEWEEKGIENVFTSSGMTSSARSDIIAYLREQSQFSSLFNNKTLDVYDINAARKALGNRTDAEIKELKKIANSRDWTEIKKAFGFGEDVSDSALYGIVDKINKVDSDAITNIAHGLNMTVEQFERANADGSFDWLTEGDIINGADKLIEKFSELSNIFLDLADDSMLTSENMDKLIKNYKFLLRGDNGEIGIQYVLKNIGEVLKEGANSPVAQAYIGMKATEIRKDEDIFSLVKNDPRYLQGFNDEQKKIIAASSTFEEAMSNLGISSDDPSVKAFWNIAKDLVGEFDIYSALQEQLIEYQKNEYDIEINNLESIKESLNDVNKQREKEIELIKAKEALENASKEKKRVYREGVGFVYTSDQEALKSAQEKVDELEAQKTQEDIQYQIDILEQQKDFLEQISKEKEVEALKTAVDTYFGETKAIDIITAILKLNNPDLTSDIIKEIETTGEKNTDNVEKEKIENAKKFYDDVVKDYQKFLNEENYKGSGMSAGEILLTQGSSPYYSSAKEEENVWINKINGKRTDYVNLSGDRSIPEFEAKGKADAKSKFDVNLDDTFFKGLGIATNTDLATSYEDLFMNIRIAEQTSDWKGAVEGTSGKHIAVSKQLSDGTFSKWSRPFDKSVSGAEAVSKIENGSLFVEDKGKENRIFYKDVDGNIHTVEVMWSDGTWKTKVGSTLFSSSFNEHAIGTYSAPGGASLINENGLESIITPEGTITSLPAKSGIVPADLTRNLWALGEVAPNLIARLGGNNLQTNNSNSATDNSINIQNLDATFNTQSDFDGRKFLTDLRNQVILTANNH